MAAERTAGHQIHVEGAIDLHCHFGPEPAVERLTGVAHRVDPIEAVRDAADVGMRSIVLKAHEFPSVTAAYLANREGTGVTVFGGICCDAPVGGLNPAAVEAALLSGVKIVWLPTISAAGYDPVKRSRAFFGATEGLVVVDAAGDLLPDVRAIIDLVRDADAVLATGHTTLAEHLAVATAMSGRGRLVVTHAMQEGAGPELELEDCIALAELGAVIEFSAHTCLGKPATTARVAQAIQAVGVDRCVLSSDFGWNVELPAPAAGLQDYATALWEQGATEEQLQVMLCRNPASLLGLD